MVFHQGVTATSPATGKPSLNEIELTGNIQVQGFACFNSGVMNSSLSGVEGNEVVAQFTMDDASTLGVIGNLTDPTESRIGASVLLITGGKCGSSPVFYQFSELDRRN